jgi:hypothetical protein
LKNNNVIVKIRLLLILFIFTKFFSFGFAQELQNKSVEGIVSSRDPESIEETREQQFLFLIDEAYLQEKGLWQLTLGTEYWSHQRESESEMDDGTPETTTQTRNLWRSYAEVEYGLADWLQLEFEVPYSHLSQDTTEDDGSSTSSEHLSEWGIEDVSAGLAVRLMKEEDDIWWKPTLSFWGEAKMPTGDWEKGLGTDRWGWETGAAASKFLTEQYIVHLSLSLGQTQNALEAGESESADETEIEYGAAFVYRPTDKLEWILETVVESEREKTEEGTHWTDYWYLVPGVRYALNDGVEIGLGSPVGLTSESYDWGVIGKMIFEW